MAVTTASASSTALVPSKRAADNLALLNRAANAASSRSAENTFRHVEWGRINVRGFLIGVTTKLSKNNKEYNILRLLVWNQDADEMGVLAPHYGRYDSTTGVFKAVRQTQGEKLKQRTDRQKVPDNEADWEYDEIAPGSTMEIRDFQRSISKDSEGSFVTVVDVASSAWEDDVPDEQNKGELKHIKLVSWRCAAVKIDDNHHFPRAVPYQVLRNVLLPNNFVGNVEDEAYDQRSLVLRVCLGDEMSKQLGEEKFAVAQFVASKKVEEFYSKVGKSATEDIRALFNGALIQQEGMPGDPKRTIFKLSAYKDELIPAFKISDHHLWTDVFYNIAHLIPAVYSVRIDREKSHTSTFTEEGVAAKNRPKTAGKVEEFDASGAVIPAAAAADAEMEVDVADADAGLKGTVNAIIFDAYAYKDVLVPAGGDYLKRNIAKWRPAGSKANKEAEIKQVDISSVDEVFNVSEKPSMFAALCEHAKMNRGSFGVMTNALTLDATTIGKCGKMTTAEGEELLEGKPVNGLTLAFHGGQPKFALFFFNHVRREQALAGLSIDIPAAIKGLQSGKSGLRGIEGSSAAASKPAKLPALPAPKAAAPPKPAIVAPNDADDIFGGGGGVSSSEVAVEAVGKKAKKGHK